MVLVAALTGAGVALLERRLAADASSVGGLTVAVVASVSAGVMRSGVPAGMTFFRVDVIGMWLVARTGLRRE